MGRPAHNVTLDGAGVELNDARPLYLDAATTTDVRLEGPALSVRVTGQAVRLMPLRLVSRIQCNAKTVFTTEALLACASRGIGIVFVDADAGVLARILGSPGSLSSLPGRLSEFLGTADWKERYSIWLHAEERRAAARVQWRLGIIGPALPNGALASRLQAAAASALGDRQLAEKTSEWLEQAIFGAVFARLQKLGFGARSELGQDGHPDLVSDLTRILAWYAEPWRLEWLAWRESVARARDRSLAAPGRVDLIRVFERHADRFGEFLSEITNRLHRWLIEMA